MLCPDSILPDFGRAQYNCYQNISSVPNISHAHTCGCVVLSLNATAYVFGFMIFSDLYIDRDSGPMHIVKENNNMVIQAVNILWKHSMPSGWKSTRNPCPPYTVLGDAWFASSSSSEGGFTWASGQRSPSDTLSLSRSISAGGDWCILTSGRLVMSLLTCQPWFRGRYVVKYLLSR